jgi:hypothetical protein
MKPGRVTSPQQLWRTQFDKQLTNDMMERVLKQTIALVRKVERKTPWRDAQTSDDRLHTAILKTLDGTKRWDPTRIDLERHFLGAIASDVSHELERAVKFRHVPLDAENQNVEELEHETSEALRGARESKDEVPKEAWWSIAMAEFRRHAPDDTGVLAIIDAYGHDKLTRRDVMAHAGMSSRQYHAAYQRLVRIAQNIDDDVRDLIMQAIA